MVLIPLSLCLGKFGIFGGDSANDGGIADQIGQSESKQECLVAQSIF